MNTKLKLVLFAVIAIGGVAGAPKAKANILAINEMKEELTSLTEKYSESRANLARAKAEHKNLKSAHKDLVKSIKLAVKSDDSKKKAEQASIDSVGYSHKRNPYLADMSHAKGQASLSGRSLDKGYRY